MNGITYIFAGKAVRVFVFGMVSIMTPIYMATSGYSSFYVGIALAAIIGGSIFSNIILTWYEERIGRRRLLLLFSFLMLISGIMLFSTVSLPLMLLAYFIGSISTTGTEAGPFQSIEAGIIPNLVPEEKKNRMFGIYNLIGYSASSVGAFAASTPSYFHNDLFVFRSLYLVYGLVGLLLFVLYQRLPEIGAVRQAAGKSGLGELSPGARQDIKKLSILYSIDAFGGGFVTQSLLSYWFFLVYGVSLENLGIIFLVVNIITAISTLSASYLADRIGNLKTMVYTHLLSNVFLVLIPLAGSLTGSLLFLFARQSVSQMDVPARQAFMTEIFNDKERVAANAITNTSRSVSSIFGAPVSGILLGIGLPTIPLFAGGFSKILYDVLIYSLYRKKEK